MTTLEKSLHKLGYKLAPDWDDEVEGYFRWAARQLGQERIEWIAGADKHFVFDEDEDTRLIFELTSDPVTLAAYGWHSNDRMWFRHVSKRVPRLTIKIIEAAHIWYLLRTIKMTRREELEIERRVRERHRRRP